MDFLIIFIIDEKCISICLIVLVFGANQMVFCAVQTQGASILAKKVLWNQSGYHWRTW
jgi:hypothetical protein